ncbi:MAG TPA: TauD/TfdA family dioxygenase [Ktedonobacteraceae bacterium]|nr:TauD/TfdA family dioxygenase [Ktedonobacteraceae bacterium]
MQQQDHNTPTSGTINATDLTEHQLQHEQIQTTYLSEQEQLPLIIQARSGGLDAYDWAIDNLPYLKEKLRRYGAILFRDFHVPTPADFERFASLICPVLFRENGEHVPANEVGNGNLYTPVFYAPEKKLLWHNENSFNATWPQNILFHCAYPADQGGETPIVDSRKVFQLLDPSIREVFLKKEIMYVRNYSDGGLGLPWQTVFRTSRKAEVETMCLNDAIEFEWKDNKHLRTYQIRPAVIKHPETQESIWWNQAPHWHPACLDPEVRDTLLSIYDPEDLPRNCFYGDGSIIEDEVMDAICSAYQEVEVSFPWHAGDILVLDNMLAAHARNPFQGKRKIYVSMGNMITLKDLKQI